MIRTFLANFFRNSADMTDKSATRAKVVALVAACVVTSLLLPISAFAEGKFAVVDLQIVLKSTVAGKAAQKKFNDLRDKKKASLEKTDKELAAREKKLMVGRQEIEQAIAALQGKQPGDELKAKAAAFQEEARKFELDVAKFQNSQHTAAEDLAKKEAELLKPIETTIRGKVELVAKERGLVLVVNKQVAVYSAEALDITAEVIKRCDAQ